MGPASMNILRPFKKLAPTINQRSWSCLPLQVRSCLPSLVRAKSTNVTVTCLSEEQNCSCIRQSPTPANVTKHNAIVHPLTHTLVSQYLSNSRALGRWTRAFMAGCRSCNRNPGQELVSGFLSSSLVAQNRHTSTLAAKTTRHPKVPLAKSAPLKRSGRKKPASEEVEDTSDQQSVGAYAVGEDLELYRLKPIIEAGGVYDVLDLPLDITDVLMVEAKYRVNEQPREVFFFSDGGVACWNMSESERLEVVKMARVFTRQPYKFEQIMDESEILPVVGDRTTHLVKNVIHLQTPEDQAVYDEERALEKYAFSNALAQSVNLSISEGNLEQFIDELEPETQRLRDGVSLLLNKKDVNMKLGEVFLLRHEINLETGFLDTPDIYWERDELEGLYREMISYLMVPKRTRVINERLNYCSEILGLFNNQLNDKHHVRLEWIIIILILIEVMFEILHHIEKRRMSSAATEISSEDR